jgi:hypothetical protein
MPAFLRPTDAAYDIAFMSGEPREGFSVPWVYLSPAGGFFRMHCEDAASVSVNVNFGPQPKVWFMVSPEDTQRVRLACW